MSRATRKLATIQAKEELNRIKLDKKLHRNNDLLQKHPVKKFLIVVVVVCITVLVAIGLALEYDKPVSSYNARTVSSLVLDPATLNVTIAVDNVGEVKGKPECTVRAQNPSGSYSGWEISAMNNEIAPGDTDSISVNLTISNQGAIYITQITSSCK